MENEVAYSSVGNVDSMYKGMRTIEEGKRSEQELMEYVDAEGTWKGLTSVEKGILVSTIATGTIAGTIAEPGIGTAVGAGIGLATGIIIIIVKRVKEEKAQKLLQRNQI